MGRDDRDQPRVGKVGHVFKPGPKPDNRNVCQQSADEVIDWETTQKIYPLDRRSK